MQDAYLGFAEFYDRLMDDVDYDLWTAYLARLMTAYMNFAPGLVLDSACGTGAISVRLAQRGYAVVGSDISPDMLRVAQRNAMERGIRIPFVCQDMRALSAHRSADVVLACCDGVNYLNSLEDVRRFFRSAFEALNPDGLLMFDISSAYKLEHVLGNNIFGEDRAACTYLWRNNYDPLGRLLEMQMTFFIPGEQGLYARFDETHIQRAHSAGEINELLAGSGFEIVDVFEAFTTHPPQEHSERIQWIARRRP